MLCQSGKPSCYQRNFLHIAFEGNSQLLKSYTITGSRCSHCWSVEWIKDLQKPVEAYFSCLFIAPMCRYLSSPTFLTPFHVFFFLLKYCFVQDLCLPLPWRSCTQKQVRKTWNERRYLCCFMVFPLLIILLLNETIVGGLNDISKPRT